MVKLLNVKDAAERIRCSEAKVYRLITLNRITAIKISGSYRFTDTMVDDYIKEAKKCCHT